MIKANGAKLEWREYEFGVRFADNQVIKCITYSQAVRVAEMHGATPVMRTVYHSPWEEAFKDETADH